jgi:hypothetical protein
MMPAAVNVLGTIVAMLCAFLLLNAYFKVRNRLLLWSGLCFVGLAASNALLYLDLRVVPNTNLYTLRLSVAAFSLLLLVYGLIFESD